MKLKSNQSCEGGPIILSAAYKLEKLCPQDCGPRYPIALLSKLARPASLVTASLVRLKSGRLPESGEPDWIRKRLNYI